MLLDSFEIYCFLLSEFRAQCDASDERLARAAHERKPRVGLGTGRRDSHGQSVSSERNLATVVVFLIERHFSFCSGQTKP